jgi:hypothetical protein
MLRDWTDEELISYFEIHSRTERALFAKEHVARLMKLGGSPELHLDRVPSFIPVHAAEADLLIKRKRFRVIEGGKKP